MRINKSDKIRLRKFLCNMVDRNESFINDEIATENDIKDLEMFERVIAELDKDLSKNKKRLK